MKPEVVPFTKLSLLRFGDGEINSIVNQVKGDRKDRNLFHPILDVHIADKTALIEFSQYAIINNIFRFDFL